MSTNHSQPQCVTRDDARPAATSAAQRQRAYRARRRRALIDATGQEAAASRVTLLSMVRLDLAALDTRSTPPNMITPLRSSVRRVLNVIVTRYAIKL